MTAVFLQTLPIEILSQIASCITDLRSLNAFGSLCRALRAAVAPRQYAGVVDFLYGSKKDKLGRSLPLLQIVLCPLQDYPSYSNSQKNARFEALFFPFLRPNEVFDDSQLPQESLCPGGSPFFLATLEILKEIDHERNAWYLPSSKRHGLALALKANLLPLAKWAYSLAQDKIWSGDHDFILAATFSGNIEVVQWVAQAGLHKRFDKFRRKGVPLWNPIEVAVEENYRDILDYLVEIARDEPEMDYILTSRVTIELGVGNNDLRFLETWLTRRGDPKSAAKQAGAVLNTAVTQLLHSRGFDLEFAFQSACRALCNRDEPGVAPTAQVVAYLDLLLDWKDAIPQVEQAKSFWLYVGLFGVKGCKPELVQYLLSRGAQLSLERGQIRMMASKLTLLESNTAKEDQFFEAVRLVRHLPWDWQEALAEWNVSGSDDPMAVRKQQLSGRMIEIYGHPNEPAAQKTEE
ncbi:hypothetical protein BDZ88DRAFT_417944 [Geranomyces variabilis]|nr:hypothetical protein BDZ88DRAFT_417944 [Geranomyces variabilis]KAJ3138286.1 hypothetical protein HDU90_001248 [Geranomyces variabilis]